MAIRKFLPVLFLVGSATGQSPYDAALLRSNPSTLPYYATEGGREGHRFAGAEVNRYRLYDFYSRQAEYYIANPSYTGLLLPPFPGLDGGRHGHWGATNEAATGAFHRDQGPAFTSVTARNARGELYLQSTGANGPAGVIIYDTIHPGVRMEYPDGRLVAGGHPFEGGADRFGFSASVAGTPRFQSKLEEWTRAGKPVARYAGYYVNHTPVLRLEIGSGAVLDQPQIIQAGSQRFFTRNLEFLDAQPDGLGFSLPQSPFPDSIFVTSPGSGGSIISDGTGDGPTVQYSVHVVGPAKCHLHEDRSGFDLSHITAGTRVILIAYTAPADDIPNAEKALTTVAKALKASAPSALTHGAPPQFPETSTVCGTVNADPGASGTAYEIDDIPVPSGNPMHAPMTISGIGFAGDGTAYVCTLTGDVWKVTGLDADLRNVVWKRFATGLDLPLGLVVVDGIPHVNTRRNIVKLQDLNGDGEADFIERFNRNDLPTGDECGRDLKRDAAGNFHFNTASGIFRLSPDGGTLAKIGHGARNPFGLGVRADGLVLSDSSEGNLGNGTCTIFESDHPENAGSVAKFKRLLYLPRGVDNSPGSRLFMNEPRFGPLGNSIVGTSYATGTWYYLVRDVVDGTPQAALVPMPGHFSAGACRSAVNPADGQVYVAGLDGWGDYATMEGCLHRIRHTGHPAPILTGWKACRNGVALTYDGDLKEAPARESFFAQQWNYVDSAKTYGSPEYSVLHPGQIGHDRLVVASVKLQADHRTVFLEMQGLLPAMCTQLHGHLTDATGRPVPVDLYLTLNKLGPDGDAVPAHAQKPVSLAVPEKDENGDTYQNLIEHFDRLAGRDPASRAVAAEVPWRKEDLNYRWFRTNLVEKQCLPCHMTGTQHDLTTYAGMMTKVDTASPYKSRIYGMTSTHSMPPYPLPTLPPGMQKALMEWIKAGAPE